jgi:hypothetical protein
MKTDLKEILYEEYIVKKKSIETISKEINIYTVKIRWMLRYFNIPVRSRGNRVGTPHRTKGYVLNEN